MAIALAVGACTSEKSDPVDAAVDTTSGGGSTAGGTATGGTATGGTGSGSNGTVTTGGSQAAGGTATTGGASTGGGGPTGDTVTAGSGGSSASGGGSQGTSNTGGAGGTGLRLPEADSPFDYQLGGGYTPPDGVRIVTRDREDSPAPGLYNICYVNGFQTQPQDNDEWLSERAELILHDEQGEPVFDEDWGEYLFDTRTTEQQLALLDTVGDWVAGCANDGFDAVEIDNLDSYSRSGGLLTEDGNVSFMARLALVAHEHGLAIGQKNSAELVARADELGTDFAVAEECNRYDECGDYQAHYGDLVFVIEYREQDFQRGCSDFPELSIVLRDLNLTTPGSSSYVFDGC